MKIIFLNYAYYFFVEQPSCFTCSIPRNFLRRTATELICRFPFSAKSPDGIRLQKKIDQ